MELLVPDNFSGSAVFSVSRSYDATTTTTHAIEEVRNVPHEIFVPVTVSTSPWYNFESFLGFGDVGDALFQSTTRVVVSYTDSVPVFSQTVGYFSYEAPYDTFVDITENFGTTTVYDGDTTNTVLDYTNVETETFLNCSSAARDTSWTGAAVLVPYMYFGPIGSEFETVSHFVQSVLTRTGIGYGNATYEYTAQQLVLGYGVETTNGLVSGNPGMGNIGIVPFSRGRSVGYPSGVTYRVGNDEGMSSIGLVEDGFSSTSPGMAVPVQYPEIKKHYRNYGDSGIDSQYSISEKTAYITRTLNQNNTFYEITDTKLLTVTGVNMAGEIKTVVSSFSYNTYTTTESTIVGVTGSVVEITSDGWQVYYGDYAQTFKFYADGAGTAHWDYLPFTLSLGGGLFTWYIFKDGSLTSSSFSNTHYEDNSSVNTRFEYSLSVGDYLVCKYPNFVWNNSYYETTGDPAWVLL
jgi:hypothetical protein